MTQKPPIGSHDIGFVLGCTLCQMNKAIQRGWFCGECFTAQEEARANWQRQAENAADARTLALGERDVLKHDNKLMEATIREQKDVNDRLAFELGGLKWEVTHTRELLRHIVAVAYKSRLSNELELTLSSVNNYLAGVPTSERDS